MSLNSKKAFALCAFIAGLVSCSAPLPKCSQQAKPINFELNRHFSFTLAGENFDTVLPVVESHCLGCHSTNAANGGVILDTKDQFDRVAQLAQENSANGHRNTALDADEQKIITDYVTLFLTPEEELPPQEEPVIEQPKQNGFASIKPILDENCNACHSTQAKSGDVILDTEEGFKLTAEIVNTLISNGHKNTSVAQKDQEAVKSFIAGLNEPQSQDPDETEQPIADGTTPIGDSSEGKSPQESGDATAEPSTGNGDVCQAPSSGHTPPPNNSADALPGDGLDAKLKEKLYPQSFLDCYNQDRVYDRRVEKCHEAKFTKRFECNWDGVFYRFQNVQGAEDQLDALKNEGWQIDQCGELENGMPVVFIIQIDDQQDEIDIDVKVISTQPLE